MLTRRLIVFASAALAMSALLFVRRPATPRGQAAPADPLPVAPVIAGVASSPASLVGLALREPDPERRAARVRAALREWAMAAPDAAAAWVLGRPADERLDAATVVLIALADRPDDAGRVARLFCDRDPTFIREHGNTLVTVLTESDLFGAALRFAEIGGPERAQWISLTLARWAEQQPQIAAEAALALGEPDGFPTVIATWSARDPAALAEFARQVPNPNERTAALTEALRRWIERDPAAAAGWIDRFEPSADLDSGATALATLPPLLARHPDVALGWAASIVDPPLRAQTLATVAQRWAQADPAAARRHIATTPELSAEDRATLLALLDRPPD